MSIVHQQPKVPKYWKLAESLRAQIASGELLPGDQLPSVAQMQAQYGISLSTVNQAVALLEKDGLVVREQGRGTFVAQRTASQVAGTLGLVLHLDSLVGAYTTDLLAGIRDEAQRQNLEILWLNDDDVSECHKADAILMYCHPTEAYLLNLPTHVPSALLLEQTADFNCVLVDDFSGAQIATRHLLEQGHRRIAYILASFSDSASRQRLAGYRAVLEEAGIAADESWVRFLMPGGTKNYRLDGETSMRDWLQDNWQQLGCTALIAHNDETAIGVMKALREQGIAVPQDLSVVGFDGTEVSELSNPMLTTVKVPLREVGAQAVQMLMEQIQTGAFPRPQRFVLPAQLKMGESTAKFKPVEER